MTSVKKLLPVEVKSINRSEGHVEVRLGGIDADGHRIHLVYYEEDPAKFNDFKKGDTFSVELVGYVRPEDQVTGDLGNQAAAKTETTSNVDKSEGVKTNASTAQVDQKRNADVSERHEGQIGKDSNP